MAFPLAAYLARTGCGRIPATLEGLTALQEAHLVTIPFENVDPFLGRVPDLSMAAIVAKLVRSRRGGYCFEHNRLFAAALDALGFRLRPVFARVYVRTPGGGPRNHLAHLVDVGADRYLVDVGFGGFAARCPVRLGGETIDAAGRRYRIGAGARPGEALLETRMAHGWEPLYGYVEDQVEAQDVEAANFLCARWDRLPFAGNLMLSRCTPGGGLTLFNTALSRRRAGAPDENETIADVGRMADVLTQAFGLGLSAMDLAAVAKRLALAGVVRAPQPHAAAY